MTHPENVDLDQWMTTEQLCDWLQVTSDWVYDRISKGALPHVKIGRRLRFKRSEMEAWVEGHRR